MAEKSHYIRIMNKTVGLNNTVEPAKLRQERTEDGYTVELATAYNIDIDKNGEPMRRRGFYKTLSTPAHSLFGGSNCFFVSGTTLYQLSNDLLSARAIRTDMQFGQRTDFVEVLDRTYYCNGYQNGYIVEGVSYPWEFEEYVGPPTHRVFSSPPIGHKLEVYNGRMYIAEGSTLWYSEPFAYSTFCLADSFIYFPYRIRTISATLEGIYVGTENRMYFLAGDGPKNFQSFSVANVGPFLGSAVKVRGYKLSGLHKLGYDPSGTVVIWASQEGIMLGLNNGRVMSLTQRRLTLPPANVSAGVIDDNRYKYLVLIQE